MPEAAKVDLEAEKSRIIEYQGLITGIKRQELVWNAVSGGAVVAYKKKAALPDGVFTGGHNARMRETEGRFANASGAVCGLR